MNTEHISKEPQFPLTNLRTGQDANRLLPSGLTRSKGRPQVCVSVIVNAFQADPAARWMYPQAPDYFRHFPDFVQAFAGQAFACATADLLENSRGAALWLPPGAQPDEEALGAFLQATIAKDKQPAMFTVFEQMGAFHPVEPHWYLPLIGVAPEAQGKGFGSLLLERTLRRCDREGLPAYLEATSPRNIALYQRHGFRAVGRIQAGDSPEIVPMKRAPR